MPPFGERTGKFWCIKKPYTLRTDVHNQRSVWRSNLHVNIPVNYYSVLFWVVSTYSVLNLCEESESFESLATHTLHGFYLHVSRTNHSGRILMGCLFCSISNESSSSHRFAVVTALTWAAALRGQLTLPGRVPLMTWGRHPPSLEREADAGYITGDYLDEERCIKG